MAKLDEYTVQFSGSLQGSHTLKIPLRETVRVKKVNGHKCKDFVRRSVASATPSGRRIILAQLPGELRVFTQKGTSMTTKSETSDDWPKIQHNVEAKRRWILLVIDDAGSGLLTQDTLKGAGYFECPADRAPSQYRDSFAEVVKDMEALQEVGRTKRTDAEIRQAVQQLHVHWNVSDSIVWNSQHFCLHLAAYILTDASFQAKKPLFIDLSQRLWTAAITAERNFVVGRGLGYMAGMAISGILTLGIGAVGFWVGAGVSIKPTSYVGDSVRSQALQLRVFSERFRGWAWIGE